MNRRVPALVAAASALAGACTVFLPQHAAALVALAAGTVVVVLSASVLVLVATVVGREPPVTDLDVAEPARAPGLDPPGLRDARRDLRLPAARTGLPAPVWERLVVASVLRLQRRGVDVDSPRTRDEGRSLLTPRTWALLTTRPGQGDRADPGAVATVVHRTLDELDQLASTPGASTRGAHHGHR